MDLTAVDIMILKKFKDNDITWLPYEKSIDMEAAEYNKEEDEKKKKEDKKKKEEDEECWKSIQKMDNAPKIKKYLKKNGFKPPINDMKKNEE